MKSRYFPILAAIILGLAGLGYAQNSYFNAETGNVDADAAQALAVTPVSPAYTGYAYFNAEIGNVPPLQEFSTPALVRYAGKPGTLRIEARVKVGDANLKPGEYIVRHVQIGKEHFVEFAQTVENDFAPEGMPVYEVKTVAKADCKMMEPLNSVATRTELTPKTNGTVASLEIRGEKVEHLF